MGNPIDNSKDILGSTLTRLREIDESSRAQQQDRDRAEQANRQQNNPTQQQIQQQAFQTKKTPTTPRPENNAHAAADEHEHLQAQRQKNFQQAVQQGQQMQDLHGQGVKEQLQSRFSQAQNQLPQNQSQNPRAPGVTANLLQNIRTATQTGSQNPQAQLKSNPGAQNNSQASGQTQNHAGEGVRLGEWTRQMGVFEGGRLPQQGHSPNPEVLLQRSAQNYVKAESTNPQSTLGRSYPQGAVTRLPQAQFQQLFSQTIARLFEIPQGETQLPPLAVLFEQGHIFVREGNRVRVFQLLEDGSLMEVESEGEEGGGRHGASLSAEAKGQIHLLLKQQGLQSKLKDEARGFQELRGEASEHLSEKTGKFYLLQDSHLPELWQDGTSFSHLLRKVLEEGLQIGTYLDIGEETQFSPKSEWQAFFARMLQMNSAERSATKSFDELFDFLFRGLFDKEGVGRTLVSDFKYNLKGKAREEKFAQIPLADVEAELMEFLNELKPGQKISKETLVEFLGGDLAFIQMAHLSDKFRGEMLSNTYKDIQFNPASKINPYSQANMERLLFAKTRKENPLILNQIDALTSPVEGNPKWKIWFEGNAKWLTYVGYGMIGFAVLLLLIFSLRKS
ncbi:MAG: hypothetical protein HQM15_11145 [Deltaproteobacteria bacterium]|nr:hypothetical protein [Deltaproteobacteria bacterium]